jgi:type I restriction enzyme, S subunit
MRFQPYENYIELTVSSLKQVPAHWSAVSLKRIVKIRYGIGEPPKYKPSGVPLIRATNVDAGAIDADGLVFVDPDDIPVNRIVWLSPGDIIVVRSGAYTGDSATIRCEHCPCIAGFDMVVTAFGCLSEFLQYALLSSYLKKDQIDLEKLRAAQPHLNAEELGSCILVLPPPNEQSAIVSYLDEQTAKIDALVGEQMQLIELLKEKRRAVISHAVTKGLDSNAAMKDAGVEWLGDIPAQWGICKFSREVHIAEGQVDPEADTYRSMLLIAPNHVESGTGRLISIETSDEQGAESGKYLCRKGDVIYSKIRPVRWCASRKQNAFELHCSRLGNSQSKDPRGISANCLFVPR